MTGWASLPACAVLRALGGQAVRVHHDGARTVAQGSGRRLSTSDQPEKTTTGLDDPDDSHDPCDIPRHGTSPQERSVGRPDERPRWHEAPEHRRSPAAVGPAVPAGARCHGWRSPARQRPAGTCAPQAPTRQHEHADSVPVPDCDADLVVRSAERLQERRGLQEKSRLHSRWSGRTCRSSGEGHQGSRRYVYLGDIRIPDPD